jgi:acyl-CoA synthetase (AMP-forming)/AMP-acid ligase II
VTSFNLSELFECVADRVPEREAIVAHERRLTYAQLEARANRLAHALAARGIGAGDHVGLVLANGSEYVEAMIAAYKLRAVPINVNYRYVPAELRALFEDADLRGVIVHRSFAPRVLEAGEELPLLRTTLVVDDHSRVVVPEPVDDYETALSFASEKRDFSGRSSDDLYIVYTGGTTGRPKGVMWRHEDIFFAAMGGGDPLRTAGPIARLEELSSRITPQPVIALAAPPYMHAAAQWLMWSELTTGGTLVTTPHGAFDPDAIWRLVESESVGMLLIVGDAMATPLCDALEGRRDREPPRALFAVASGGALFSPAVKQRLQSLLPGRLVMDGLGSSETGALGTETPGVAAESGSARFRVGADTAVLGESLRPLTPGSGEVGQLARRGHIPIGYYKDPAKSRATFVDVGGVRWALPGDLARVGADGAIELLGRGSSSINSGGEKVFPEEVEAALKAHPAVFDALVVGVRDARWGERVVALVQPRAGARFEPEALRDFCRARLAAYKLPRDFVVLDALERTPAGKADYRWAKATAEARLAKPTA